MKNKLALIILLTCFCLSYSQENNLFILLDSSTGISKVKSKNEILIVEKYKMSLNSSQIKYDLILDKNNNLTKKVLLQNDQKRYLNFLYKNENNDNKPILIKKNKIKNYLTYKEMSNIKDYNNLQKILTYFKDIYIIERYDMNAEFMIAKRVVYEKSKCRL